MIFFTYKFRMLLDWTSLHMASRVTGVFGPFFIQGKGGGSGEPSCIKYQNPLFGFVPMDCFVFLPFSQILNDLAVLFL